MKTNSARFLGTTKYMEVSYLKFAFPCKQHIHEFINARDAERFSLAVLVLKKAANTTCKQGFERPSSIGLTILGYTVLGVIVNRCGWWTDITTLINAYKMDIQDINNYGASI